jgi:hypothetical protein
MAGDDLRTKREPLGVIAQLAIVRKLIVAEFYDVTPAWLAGLAALILA